MRVLEEGEVELCKEIYKKDNELDDLEVKIDAEAVRYISLRSPVASELRLLAVGMKAGHDLERIGDEAVSIAKRANRIHLMMPPKDIGHLPQMADMALGMIQDATDCLVSENDDPQSGIDICKRDKDVDAMHRDNCENWTRAIQENPTIAPSAIELLFISKSLERVADHACNLAEDVVFLNSGEDIRHTKSIKKSLA